MIQRQSRHATKRDRKRLLKMLEQTQSEQTNRFNGRCQDWPSKVATSYQRAENRFPLHTLAMESAMRGSSEVSRIISSDFRELELRLIRAFGIPYIVLEGIHDASVVPDEKTAEDPLRLPDPNDKN